MCSRETYVSMFASLSAAVDFEARALSSGDEFLPPFARAVRDDTDEPTPEYWAWLTAQTEDAHV